MHQKIFYDIYLGDWYFRQSLNGVNIMVSSFFAYYSFYDSNGNELGDGNYSFDYNYTDYIKANKFHDEISDWLLGDLKNRFPNTARVVIKNLTRLS